jgi:hypothetical protein
MPYLRSAFAVLARLLHETAMIRKSTSLNTFRD